MINYRYILIIICTIPWVVSGQYPHDGKRDHIWMFGYDNYPPNWGGTSLNFNQTPPVTNYVAQEINLDGADASISDTNGNLLFYTNEMYVANANHQIMPNGDSLTPGDLFNYYGNDGYRLPQGVLILPFPQSNHLFIIIHEKLIWSNQYFDLAKGLYYSIVDMNLDGGLGDVTQKNILFNNDSLDPGLITATRHANGRDWWILIPEFMHNRYYRYLICPTGIILVGQQTIGTPSSMMELGQACFSPDGSKYVRFAATDINLPYRLEVFNFNRCTGLLSNYRNLWYIDNAYAAGVAISPNSRYMYVSAQTKINQYDLIADNIAASKQTVAVYDGFIDPLFSLGSTYFFMAQLAPDGKIYLSTQNGTQYLHVINQPDNPGISCNVTQHSLHLNTFNSTSLPNFPNFRLGPLPCSECDTLGLSVTSIQGKVTYDNSILTPLGNCWVILKTIEGTIIDSALTNTSGNYRFCGISNGIYKIVAKPTQPWGGVNATDALLVAKYFVQLTTLTGLSLKAADVNLSSNVNATDAFLIQKRFVGLINSFPAGNWISEEMTVTFTGSPLQNINIKCLCVGDVNRSYY